MNLEKLEKTGNQKASENERTPEEVMAEKMLEQFSVFEIGAMVEGLQRTNSAIKESLEKDPAGTNNSNIHKETLSKLEEKLYKIFQAARDMKGE